MVVNLTKAISFNGFYVIFSNYYRTFSMTFSFNITTHTDIYIRYDCTHNFMQSNCWYVRERTLNALLKCIVQFILGIVLWIDQEQTFIIKEIEPFLFNWNLNMTEWMKHPCNYHVNAKTLQLLLLLLVLFN